MRTSYSLVEGRGIMIEHWGEQLRLTPGAPVKRGELALAA